MKIKKVDTYVYDKKKIVRDSVERLLDTIDESFENICSNDNLDNSEVKNLEDKLNSLSEYLNSINVRKTKDKFLETIHYAKNLVADISENLSIAEEEGELVWFSTKYKFQEQLISSVEDLLAVCKKLKLKGVKNDI